MRVAMPVFLLLLAARAASAQDPFRAVEEALAAGEEAGVRALVELVRTTSDGQTRHLHLTRATALFRGRGASRALLQALDRLVGILPDEVSVLHFRGWLRRELKLLRGARQDLEAARRLNPDAAAITGDLALMAARGFRYEEAADLYRGSRPRWSAYYRSLSRSLSAATLRQVVLILVGFALLVGLGWLLERVARA